MTPADETGSSEVLPSDGSVRWPLWGGTAHLLVRPRTGTTLGVTELIAARDAVDEVVAAVDAACSRFRADSEVSRLARAGGAETVVSRTLAEALAAALRAARLTDGAVDPTLGRSMVALGYDRDLAQIPADRPDARPPAPTVVRAAAWQDVELDVVRRTVRVPPGVLLDLGATAKAYAADRAAAAATARTGLPVLVGLAGDIAVAGTEAEHPWTVRVAERPDDLGGPLVAVHDGGVATSTTRARRWALAGLPVHHLLDPVTGLPAEEHWRTVTVAAASCLDANIASTATVVKGPSGLEWLRGTGLPARLVDADGAVVTVNGWPPEDGGAA
jgi:thiamine biosynthesis lipoprotein